MDDMYGRVSTRGDPRSTGAPAPRYRTPKDDAPAYDPLLWRESDTSYLASLRTYAMTHSPPPARATATRHGGPPQRPPPPESFVSSSWTAAQPHGGDEAARLSRFHSVRLDAPTSWLGRLFRFMAPGLYARYQGNVTAEDVRQLPTAELIRLMQLALSAGEVDQSAMLARELSRRKLALQMSVCPNPAEAAQSAPATHGGVAPPPSAGAYVGRGAEPGAYDEAVSRPPFTSTPASETGDHTDASHRSVLSPWASELTGAPSFGHTLAPTARSTAEARPSASYEVAGGSAWGRHPRWQ
ncbi:hypothetical protein NESM_000399000 [Novymonas esmeraldas]|uniref:Uncharacterized protein n=1 Tax=Novymonas esmeraldas TaxID=1808958 RepID=A0AAW0ENB7_9TRYP